METLFIMLKNVIIFVLLAVPGALMVKGKLLTGKDTATEEDSQYVSLLNHLTKDAPPVFLAATAEDFLTNFGAMPVAQKYASLGLGYELHIFQHGPHGYSLGDETSCDGSSQMLNASYAKWLDMSADWLHKLFGKLEFQDKSTSKMMQYMVELGFVTPGQGGGDFA